MVHPLDLMENLYRLEILVLEVLHLNKMQQQERLSKLHWPLVYLLRKQWQKLQQLQEFHHHQVVSEEILCQQQLEVMNSQEVLLVLEVQETLVPEVLEILAPEVLEILAPEVLEILALAVKETLVRVVLEILVRVVLEILVLADQEMVTHLHS